MVQTNYSGYLFNEASTLKITTIPPENSSISSISKEIPLYRPIDPKTPNAPDDGVRLIFIKPSNSKLSGTKPAFYMLLEDLQNRLALVGGKYDDIYGKDWENVSNAWNAWSGNGDALGTSMFLECRAPPPSIRSGDLDALLKTQICNQYRAYIDLFNRANRPAPTGTVSPRFWNGSLPPKTSITFYFEGSPLVEDERLKSFYETALEEVKFKPKCLIYDPKSASTSNLIRYYIHPQGYYTIWISKNDLGILKGLQKSPVADPRPFPTEDMGDAAHWLLTRVDKAGDKENPKVSEALEALPQLTVTELTRAKLERASRATRNPDQNDVMNGHGAPEVAKILWPNLKKAEYERIAEWLHRSAFSFGGLGDGKALPNSSQVVNNLVFGTYEANTQMIRYEDMIKQYIRFLPKRDSGPSASVTTEPNYNVPGQDGAWMRAKHWAWLAPKLEYRVSSLIHGFDQYINFNVTLDLFGRNVPTRLEGWIDQMVQNDVYEHIYQPYLG